MDVSIFAFIIVKQRIKPQPAPGTDHGIDPSHCISIDKSLFLVMLIAPKRSGCDLDSLNPLSP